jgi:hypothetical protein
MCKSPHQYIAVVRDEDIGFNLNAKMIVVLSSCPNFGHFILPFSALAYQLWGLDRCIAMNLPSS